MTGRRPGREVDTLDLIQESVVVFDLEGRVTTWNAAAERIYGWTRTDAIGTKLNELLQCRPREPRPRIAADFPESGRWEGEITRTNADGGEVIVRVRRSLRHDEAGQPLDIVETSVDITEARRTEEALKRVEYQYSNLFQAMAASFWELDFSAVSEMIRDLRKSGVDDLKTYFRTHRDFVRQMIRKTRILDVNNQTVELFGHGRKQEILKDLSRFWPDESTDIFADSVLAAVAGKPHYSHETRFRTLDGRELDTLFTACLPPEMVARGKLMVGIIDITATKKAKTALEGSESRYRNLFHFMPIPLWQLDGTNLLAMFEQLRAEGVEELGPYIDAHPEFVRQAMDAVKVVEVNRRSVELVGARDAAELQGPVARFWSETPDVYRRILERRYAGEMECTEQVKVLAFDGRMVDAIFTSAFFKGPNDTAIALVGLIDITDRMQAQEMLTQVQAEFAHAARVSMLGELTASIAHEVNQPLAAIATNGEAALRWLNRPRPELAEVRELMGRTVGDARRAADIIGRIRDMATRSVPKRAPVNLDVIIEETMMFLSSELRRQGVVTRTELAADLPTVSVDRVQIQQVIVNLAVNAVQAMAQAEGSERRLTIRAGRREHMVCVQVDDRGPGISPENEERLFESFFTTKPSGMGIGLAVCKSIIEAHGGEISATNLPDGRGARFSFSLPVPNPVQFAQPSGAMPGA